MATLSLTLSNTPSTSGSSRLTSSFSFSFSPSLSSKKNTIGLPQLQANRCFKCYNNTLSSLPVKKSRVSTCISATMAANVVQEVLPPALDSTSDPPAVFDGTTRLYISYTCPFAQRVWITRNCKQGLQEKIKLVPIDLKNRPDWYKEKVYPANKVSLRNAIDLEAGLSVVTLKKQIVVPSLEHNNKVKGESLDLIKYVDSHFEGPSLFPDDPTKKEFAEELFAYTDTFSKSVVSFMKGDGNEPGAAFDHIETALSKFNEGPFFLGQFSLVDIAYAPFIERFQPFLLEVKKYDITAGRPKLAAWIEVQHNPVIFRFSFYCCSYTEMCILFQ
ncbi:hypothetical protein Pint_06157 [Pistacia integerrima]|uniref:Uncharacterized protein n=1 Tax=Pistacia integerrima TaxID=434235 RepID=A0ACC0Z2M0_9ROSI|nr:hypothetical protein Pint_06157 [Pistacia integerrima]